MNTQEAQAQIVQAVKDRGYWEGWTLEQLLARNIAKLQEEVSEASSCVFVEGGWLLHSQINNVGELARIAFDSRKVWEGTDAIDLFEVADLKAELADVGVVLLHMAGVLEELTGEPFDVVAEAVKKATADVTRGVR